MPRVIHFELAADDTTRAIQFYQSIFDWNFQQWGEDGYWLITTGEGEERGINGGLGRRTEPGEFTTNIIDVPNIDEFVEKVVANGGMLVVPKTVVRGIGHLAYCKDTEGNTFGMMQHDPSAA